MSGEAKIGAATAISVAIRLDSSECVGREEWWSETAREGVAGEMREARLAASGRVRTASPGEPDR